MENTISLSLGTLIDLVILGLLLATIFYALRLSAQLKVLKQSKVELERLVSNLAANISRAQEAIQEMHEVADESSDELNSLIKQARGLSDELQLITEVGGNLAKRLENSVVGKNAKEEEEQPRPAEKPALLKREEPATFKEEMEKTDPVHAHRDAMERMSEQVRSKPHPAGGGAFMIRDREFEDEDFLQEDNDYDRRIDEEFEALTSRAERELASALKRRRRYDA